MISILDFLVECFGDFLGTVDDMSFGRGNGSLLTFFLAAFVIGMLINIIFSDRG